MLLDLGKSNEFVTQNPSNSPIKNDDLNISRSCKKGFHSMTSVLTGVPNPVKK